MSKKQTITYIVIGIVLVLIYWLFFTGLDESTESAEQAAVIEEVLKSQDADQQAAAAANSKEDAARMALEKQIAEYTAAIAKGDDLELLYYKRAAAQEQLQRYRAAEEDYTKAIEINPESANSYFNRGLVHEKMGLYQEALQDYTAAIQLKPDNYRLYNTRALVYAEQGLFEKALADYTKAIELNNAYPQAYFNLGTLYERQKDFANAKANYTKAIQAHAMQTEDVDPKEAQADLVEAYYRRAITSYVTTDYQSALEDLNKAIELDPRNVKCFQLRSNVYDKTGNVAAAAADEATAQTLSLESLLPGAQSDAPGGVAPNE